MPAEISLAGIGLSARQRADLKDGALGDDVYVQFVCQTGEGEHDPNALPDDRVRPSHAAFHGKIFKLADAPVPPLDYGCRCAIKYVAAPDTLMANLLDDVADKEPTTPTQATEEWLKENIPEYDSLKHAAAAATVKDALSVVTLKAKKLDIGAARMIASMVVDVLLGKRSQ